MAGFREMTSAFPLLSVRIEADFPEKPRVLAEVEFSVGSGEILGLIGSSGSRKSTVSLAVLRLLEQRGGRVRGRILFDGRDLMDCTPKELRSIRGREIGLVLQ